MISTRRDERGSIAPLALVYVMVALAAALIVAAAAHLYLARKQLFALADATALAAANSYELDAVQLEHGVPVVALDEQQVRAAAIDYLARHDDAHGEIVAVQVSGNTVAVTLRTDWEAPFGLELIPGEVEITVTATATSELR